MTRWAVITVVILLASTLPYTNDREVHRSTAFGEGDGLDLDWGDLEEITDPEDYYIAENGNAYGYLDKGQTAAVHDGKVYVVWETSERKNGGTMISLRVLDDGDWKDIRTVGGKEDGIIDTQPAVAAFKGGIYVVWQRAEGDDTEIMCKVLELGEWSSCGEVSQKDDFGRDSSPRLAVSRDLLWATWVTRSPVTGKDPGGGDVVVRSFNGVEWSEEITVLNPTPANGMDEAPVAIGYGDSLVVAWETRDATISDGDDLDIVLRKYEDGQWGETLEVTGKDNGDDDDTGPGMEVFEDEVHIFWQSGGDRVSETDIHSATYDGKDISKEKSLVPGHNQAADENPDGAVHDGRLFVVWNSNDPDLTRGQDDDIVVAMFDGEGWSTPSEVTPEDYQEGGHGHLAAQDRLPVAVSSGEALLVIWEQDDQRSSVTDPGDLKYRRHPPRASETDPLIVILALLVVLVLLIALLLALLGRRRSPKVLRYERQRELRKKARSKAGSRRRRKSRGK